MAPDGATSQTSPNDRDTADHVEVPSSQSRFPPIIHKWMCIIALELQDGRILFQDCLEIHVNRAKRWAREDGRKIVAIVRLKP